MSENQSYTHDIERYFRYRKPTERESSRLSILWSNAEALAHLIDIHCPEGEDKITALDLLLQCMMRADLSIMRQRFPKRIGPTTNG